jgi:hypothetical protein
MNEWKERGMVDSAMLDEREREREREREKDLVCVG